ncbi:MAG TPA: DUF4238 domain-containing protein [Rhizomicrobium sp.]|nr:DUF4238 domain-containing protein [Rhizomicrobium sp.]
MTAQDPINHHYLPIFYQQGWATDGRVVRYYRPFDVVVASPTGMKYTGCEEYLYSMDGLPSGRSQALETQFFKPIDSMAATALQKMLAGGLNQMTNDDRVNWTRFMLSTQLRNPHGLAELKQAVEKVVRENTDKDDPEYNEVRKPDDPATIYAWTLKHQPHVIENAYKNMLPGLIDHEGVGHYIINMHWATIDLSKASHTLLTGDRPFINPHGLKDPKAALLFPLGPGLLFAATNGRAQTGQLVGHKPSYLARRMNEYIAGRAVNMVIGKDRSHLAFVENRLRPLDQAPPPGPVGKGMPGVPV